jgi:hypothetical protein
LQALISESDEFRQVLIQGNGYARICQELQAIELDSWQEYTLLKIDYNVDVKPVYLLKNTCFSTGDIHAEQVPPDIQFSSRSELGKLGNSPREFFCTNLRLSSTYLG